VSLVPCTRTRHAGSLALIAGGAFALTKVDEGFLEFMDDASCKVGWGGVGAFNVTTGERVRAF
jgi:hypothetical protein